MAARVSAVAYRWGIVQFVLAKEAGRENGEDRGMRDWNVGERERKENKRWRKSQVKTERDHGEKKRAKGSKEGNKKACSFDPPVHWNAVSVRR